MIVSIKKYHKNISQKRMKYIKGEKGKLVKDIEASDKKSFIDGTDNEDCEEWGEWVKMRISKLYSASIWNSEFYTSLLTLSVVKKFERYRVSIREHAV